MNCPVYILLFVRNLLEIEGYDASKLIVVFYKSFENFSKVKKNRLNMEVITTLIDTIIREAFERIINKIKEGKKLSDAEVQLLIISQMRKDQESIAKSLEDFKNDTNRRFNEMDKKIDDLKNYVEKRFEQVEKRFEQIDKRFEQVDKRFEQVDKRFESIEEEIKFLRREISSIKSDIINLLKEKI